MHPAGRNDRGHRDPLLLPPSLQRRIDLCRQKIAGNPHRRASTAHPVGVTQKQQLGLENQIHGNPRTSAPLPQCRAARGLSHDPNPLHFPCACMCCGPEWGPDRSSFLEPLRRREWLVGIQQNFRTHSRGPSQPCRCCSGILGWYRPAG